MAKTALLDYCTLVHRDIDAETTHCAAHFSLSPSKKAKIHISQTFPSNMKLQPGYR